MTRNSRRDFLKALAATGFYANTVFAQEKVNKVNVRGGAIDVHHHHQPPALGPGVGVRGGRGP
jgi:hypothetical protein